MSKAETSAVVGFAALGDATRLALFTRLAGGAALSIAALGAGTAITRQAVAKHLRVLEDAGLVVSARAGRESRYALQPSGVAALRDYLATVAAQWDDALGRLRAFIGDQASSDVSDASTAGLSK